MTSSSFLPEQHHHPAIQQEHRPRHYHLGTTTSRINKHKVGNISTSSSSSSSKQECQSPSSPSSASASAYSSSFYLPPIQRQKWGDQQIRPHVNWGDLFFDLFYVAAAYNLATVIKTDPTWKGVFYFLSLFGSVFASFWQSKMIHESRFEMPDDIIHRLLEVIQLCALATSVLHIRPVEYMSRGADHPDLFMYCLGLVLGSLIHILLLCEIRFVWVVGQEHVAKRAAGRDLRHHGVSFALQVAALVYAACLYYGGDNTIGGEEGSFLGEEYHAPVVLLLLNWAMKPIAMYMVYVVCSGGDIKHKSVPMNIDFAIHRYGEWTMLILGESILSLLIVNDISRKNEAEYYFTFYLGIVSVTLLQFLYFKSQPHDADHHALRRTRTSGFVFTIWLQIYSAALIIVGVSYKMLLTEYTSEYADKEENQAVYAQVGGGDTSNYPELYTVPSYSTQERRQRIANLYCFGLATVFLSLDMMNVAHTGLKITSNRCHHPENGKFRIKALALVVVSRIVILGFVLTLSQYVTDPEFIALIGFGTIVMQVMVRFLGYVYFPSDLIHDMEEKEFHQESIEEEKSTAAWEDSPRA